jgi:hypothetical protein
VGRLKERVFVERYSQMSSHRVLYCLFVASLLCCIERSLKFVMSGSRDSDRDSNGSSNSHKAPFTPSGEDYDYEEYEHADERDQRNLQNMQQPKQPAHHAAHKRPLRLGKKNRHNNLRNSELHKSKVDEKKGEGRYKDILEQDIEIEPSFLINDPIFDRLNDSHPPSVLRFDNVTTQGRFSIISMQVDHHSDTRWMIPSFHNKYSAGWNRTVELSKNNRVCVDLM